ncbi:DUF5686 family protein [Lacinutrix venerupis]|uniref:Alginate export domain-containing protein n=1 Tax=Lacinutrix venerupis TaxID=1486034 RepID=A0AAC9LM59_9FLAO|nr:DUF5686 family protein [Lacinutrix venerupis]APY01401.1 hypothetical protein BWR22_14180 [Lacinutrix venerupis]
MRKLLLYTLFFCFTFIAAAQTPEKETKKSTDSINSDALLKQIGNGFFPTNIWNFDLRYLIKFNQYEGFRTGLGGVTNEGFSEDFRIDSYVVYGFRDHRFKYKIGGGVLLNKDTKSWLNISYTDDLMETGSSNFLTDGRTFSFFEPRLLNISLFHKHITSAISYEHEVNPKLITETEVAVSNIDPTYNYTYVLDNTPYQSFGTSTAKVALQWNPFVEFESIDGKNKIVKDGYPKFTLQYSKSFKDVFDADFNFSKLDFRAIHKINHNKDSHTIATLSAGLAHGDTPLTHMYHAYPNNINKETILNRFSVAGINSFETMFFDEFFSDRFATLVVKHYIKPFRITSYFKPQLVLITRYAVGNMNNINRHQNVNFGTLKNGYTESGFEINKLLLGFGLSFTYRYGAYHLPKEEDNLALKFTFNITL